MIPLAVGLNEHLFAGTDFYRDFLATLLSPLRAFPVQSFQLLTEKNLLLPITLKLSLAAPSRFPLGGQPQADQAPVPYADSWGAIPTVSAKVSSFPNPSRSDWLRTLGGDSGEKNIPLGNAFRVLIRRSKVPNGLSSNCHYTPRQTPKQRLRFPSRTALLHSLPLLPQTSPRGPVPLTKTGGCFHPPQADSATSPPRPRGHSFSPLLSLRNLSTTLLLSGLKNSVHQYPPLGNSNCRQWGKVIVAHQLSDRGESLPMNHLIQGALGNGLG